MSVTVFIYPPIIIGQNTKYLDTCVFCLVNKKIVIMEKPLTLFRFYIVPIKSVDDPACTQVVQPGVFFLSDGSARVNKSAEIDRYFQPVLPGAALFRKI